jgi:hypothetical protein
VDVGDPFAGHRRQPQGIAVGEGEQKRIQPLLVEGGRIAAKPGDELRILVHADDRKPGICQGRGKREAGEAEPIDRDGPVGDVRAEDVGEPDHIEQAAVLVDDDDLVEGAVVAIAPARFLDDGLPHQPGREPSVHGDRIEIGNFLNRLVDRDVARQGPPDIPVGEDPLDAALGVDHHRDAGDVVVFGPAAHEPDGVADGGPPPHDGLKR